jgi:UrcA family protein
MQTRNIGLRLAYCASTAILLGGASSFTFGQESNAVPELKIEAARSVTREVSYPGGAKVETVQVTQNVSYKDLDLTKTADAAKLEERIAAAAKSTCGELDTLYPISASAMGTQACIKDAKERAMTQEKVAVRLASAKK